MADINEVIAAAQGLYDRKDEVGLELLIGMRYRAVKEIPALKDNVEFEPEYEAQTMGPLDDIKAVGRKILNRWNKELYSLVCNKKGDDQKDRKAILDSLSLSETAVIGAVATTLLTLGVAAAIAAPVAPLIVKRFIWPAKDELCEAWSEGIKMQD